MTPELLVIAIVAPLYLALAIKDRALAVAALAAVLPAYLVRYAIPLPMLGALPTTLLEILVLELFAVWLFTDASKKDAWRGLGTWAEPVVLLLVGATIGVAVAPDLRASLGLWRAYFVEPLLFFVVFTDVIGRKRNGRAVLGALGMSLAVVGVTAVYQKYTGYGIPNPVWQAEATRRVTSFYGFPNAIGLFAAPLVVLMAGWTMELLGAKDLRRRSLAVLTSVAALLGVFGIVFAVSEGAAIGTAAGLGLLGLLDRRTRVWTLGLVVAASLVISLVPPIRDYFSLAISLRDDSGSVRAIIWKETAALLADGPVFGAGLAGYPARVALHHQALWIEIFQYPHSVVLNFWVETGLIGLAGFLWLFVRFFRVAGNLVNDPRVGWLARAVTAAMAATLVHGLVDVPYMKNDLAILFWLLIGLVEVMRRLHEDAKKPLAIVRPPDAQWLA
jgi:O-antigen ligase